MGWLSGWDKRIKLTIDKDLIDTEAQANFPIMVYLSAASGIGDVDVSCVFDELTQDANRKKIAVTTDDGETECYVEIEFWDNANEKAVLWVKVPSVAYDADTELYLYYDADHADNTTYVGDTGDTPAKAVWDSDFEAVYHMAQDPNGDGADAIKDSTSNENHGTPAGSMTTADLVDGQIGKAIEFDGNDDYINCGSDQSDLSSSAATLEFIVKAPFVHAKVLFVDGKSGLGAGFYTDPDSGNDTLIVACGPDAGSNEVQPIINDWDDDIWNNVCITYDASHVPTCYVNNALKNNDTEANTWTEIEDDIIIARRNHGNNLAGKIDEVRISKIARSAAWIKATYYSNWDSLIAFGAEEEITIEIIANTATLIITPQSAIINWGETPANTAVLIITPQSAIIKTGRFKGKYVFTLFPHWIEPPEDSFSHKNDVFMPMVMGLSYAEEIELYSKYRAHFKYAFTDKEQIGNMNAIFDTHLGRLTALWFPSFKKDFVLTSNIGESDTIINIEDTEYEDFYPESPGTGRYIFIYVNAITWFARKITDATSTTLVMEESLGEAVLMSRVKMISILYLGRFDIDEIEWTYITPDVATTDLYFIELPDEYVDLP